MRNTLITFALLLCLSTIASAQNGTQQSRKAVVVPQESYLTAIIPQPDCPFKIEKVSLIRFLDGKFGKSYQLRNAGNKPVRAYTIALWNSDNTGDIINWRVNENEGLIMPGSTAPSNEDAVTIIPLSEELRKKLELTPPMKKIVFFMLLEVEFSDGTKYDARPVLESLTNHLDKFEIVYEKRVTN